MNKMDQMENNEEMYLMCKRIALKLLENEIKITNLEIEQIEIRMSLKEAIAEAEKRTENKTEK